MSLASDERLAEAHGVTTRHEVMPNGELRFRLIASDGSSYIRTVAGATGAWQNSHFHKQLRETYIVERGWMGFAEFGRRNKTLSLRIVREGKIVTTPILAAHNVYLPAGAVIHTVKHSGGGEATDWHASAELDQVTKLLSERELLERAGEGPSG